MTLNVQDVVPAKLCLNSYRFGQKKLILNYLRRSYYGLCKVCGYVYEGDDFEDLPDDWVCPLCGVGKDQFEEQ